MVFKFFLSLLILLLPYCAQANISVESTHLQEWKTKYLNRMSYEEKQMLANIIHLLHANSIVEYKVRQFLIPITRLNQVIKNNIDQYKNIQEDLTTLKILLDRLAVVIGTRLIYNQTLNAGIAYYNKNTVTIIDEALKEMQLYAQIKLRDWANQQEDSFNQLLKKSSESIGNTIQHFQSISELYRIMSEGQLPLQISKSDDENKSLIKLSIVLENNPELFSVTNAIINTLNETTDQAAQIILIGTQVYKEFYSILYETIMSETTDKKYTTTLFSMHGLLPDEYKSILPASDRVFDHMLQTTKMYTQIELSQS